MSPNLLILTAVDYAYSGFNTPEQKALEKVTVDEVQKLIDDAAFLRCYRQR